MATQRVRKKKLSDYVIDEIRSKIKSGELKSGDKLPNQNDLAVQLGVSRTSLREAIQKLILVGAIEQRPGFGTVIKSPTAVFYAAHLSLPLIDDARATFELLETRRIIEMGAVELAVVHAGDDQIQELGKLVEKMEKAYAGGRVDEFMKHDFAFHFLVCKATGNRVLVHQFAMLQGLLEQFMQEKGRILPLLRETALEDHRSFCRAFQGRDGEAAVRIMERHLRAIEKALVAYYDTRNNGDPALLMNS